LALVAASTDLTRGYTPTLPFAHSMATSSVEWMTKGHEILLN